MCQRLCWFWRWLFVVLTLLMPSVARAGGTIAVDVSLLDDATYARIDGLKLHERLVLRLVQEGFAVVDANAAVTVKLAGDETELRVIVQTPGAEDLERTVSIGAVPKEEIQLEVIQKVVMLVRSRPIPAPEPAPAPKPVPPRPPPPPSPKPVSPVKEPPSDDGWLVRPDRWFQIGAGVGPIVRRGGVDVTARVGSRFAITRDIGIIADFAIQPSGTDDLRIIEWSLLGGASYRARLTDFLTLDAGAEVGVQFHHFAFGQVGGNDSGVLLDFSVGLPLALTAWPVEVFGVGMRVEPGITSRSREHLAANRLLWQRGLLRGVFSLEIALQF